MTIPSQQTLSVVFSFRNEEAVLEELLRRLRAVLDPLPYDYELVFVNDASTDRSSEILREAAEHDPRVKIITMANRFGVNPCFLAGIRHASGDAVITMDTDLQDPPEVIPGMIAAWEQGADVVYATRTAREGESWFKMAATRWAYRFLHAISEIELPVDTGMFKLMSRRAAAVVARTEERDPFLRGLITWVGFPQTQILYRREARHAGRTHFPLLGKGPLNEFLAGLVSFSTLPLYTIAAIGLIAVAGTILALVLGVVRAALGHAVTASYFGITALAFLVALQLSATGILALYVARIYKQVRQRPHYVIAETIGLASPERNAPPPGNQS